MGHVSDMLTSTLSESFYLPRLERIDFARQVQKIDDDNPKFALFFSDFQTLAMYQQVQALHLAAQNVNKTPKIGSYANRWFKEFRNAVKARPLTTENYSKHAQEFYWNIRYSLICLLHAV